MAFYRRGSHKKFIIFGTLILIIVLTGYFYVLFPTMKDGRHNTFSRLRLATMLKTQLRHLNESELHFVGYLPMIYIVTPTYKRPVQKAELTRLSQTLMLVPNIHWILVEDSKVPTRLVGNLLRNSGLSYTHLHVETPKVWKFWTKEHPYPTKAVLQRNLGLKWVRCNVDTETEGIVYFGDDDNTYSLDLFEEMRWIKKVGVWPVGLVGGVKVERPKLNGSGKISGWLVKWSAKRPFAVDMAGFAVNVKLLMSRPKATFSFDVPEGYQETHFLKYLVSSPSDLEPKAYNCTKVYVWHTKTTSPNLDLEPKFPRLPTDFGIEV